MSLHWRSIRALNGNQDKGFEELCAQLARQTAPTSSKFIRNGTPDAGVECVVKCPNGDEWGWQSKYIFTTDATQWSQLDQSVQTALDGHPRLVRYYICLPIDLPDGRVKNSKSAREKWDNHVDKWKSWASDKSITIEFILWDSSHMLNELTKPANRGLAMFWFDSLGCFDDEWYSNHIKKALRSAGPRYTPKLHVDVPILRCFDAFGRTQAMVERVIGTGRKIQEAFRRISHYSDKDETSGLRSVIAPLTGQLSQLFERLDGFEECAFGSQGLHELKQTQTLAQAECNNIEAYLQNQIDTLKLLPDVCGEPGQIRHRRLEELNGMRRGIWDLKEALYCASQVYTDEATFAETQNLVLKGEAGTGKTHLLCDLARQRHQQGRPTVLLLGQSFTTTEDPARQMLSLLGLPRFSLEDLVGCLEASAQAANARCLILIDALNEGMGRQFWHPNLIGFIETIVKSPWLAIAVSVRTCYLESVVPLEILREVSVVEHHGFEEVQSEAVKNFFMNHGLEFGSAPVFSREFSNPLFLKTLCKGLKELGYRRLPRGFHGITKVFELYISAMDKILSERLDYLEKLKLVRKALQSFAVSTAQEKVPWLPLARARAVIDEQLPGRDYSRSLYKALLDEGLLMEGLSWSQDDTPEDTVSIAYERWADHLAVNQLLDEHLDEKEPCSAFKIGGPLAIYGENFHMSEGMMEALAIQVPERIGRELLSLAPYALDEWGMADAFLNSIVWRDPTACTRAMEALLRYYETGKVSMNGDVWNIRLMASTIPKHSINIEKTNLWLFSMPMAERDAIWTIAINQAWDQESAICYLVEWASSLEKGVTLDDDAIWLSSLTLCWCFTSSNRFLRDRATKAMVNLLDDRTKWMAKIVKHFAHVDDLYVMERILAVAFGVALRTFDKEGVAKLAETVHESIFSSGNPPVHILLRDYARGIIERAVFLECPLSFDPCLAQPPYPSTWPNIPTQEEIEAMEGDWTHIGKTKPDEEWSRHTIFSSVIGGDFGRYVIGTNFWFTNWLSVRLNEAEWIAPEARIEQLVSTFSIAQRKLWLTFKSKQEELRFTGLQNLRPILLDQLGPKKALALEASRRKREKDSELARQELYASIDKDQCKLLDSLLVENSQPGSDNPPKFDLHIIERYVIKRVFELGWTVEKFGWFDRTYIRDFRRLAHKAERIGKKYQWIAYHEISALIADHFRYFGTSGTRDRCANYLGPWQDSFRDIDPTHTIKKLPLSNNCDHSSAWWIQEGYSNWQSERSGRDWAHDISDIPSIKSLIETSDPEGNKWLNVFAQYHWERKNRPSETYETAENRRTWLNLKAFLVKESEVEQILAWASRLNHENRWFETRITNNSGLFLGENGWSQASLFFECPYFGNDGWSKPEKCPFEMLSIASVYTEESTGFDCSMDECFSMKLPCSQVIRDWKIRWTGTGADFSDAQDRVVVKDPSVHENGDSCLLLKQEEFLDYLKGHNLSIVWAVSGGKSRSAPNFDHKEFFESRFYGAFTFCENALKGEILKDLDR